MSRPVGMATPTVEELEAEIERLRDRIARAMVEDADQNAEIERLRAALEKAKNMIVEFIQMADQPLEYRLNTVKRAQVLLDSIAREAREKDKG